MTWLVSMAWSPLTIQHTHTPRDTNNPQWPPPPTPQNLGTAGACYALATP